MINLNQLFHEAYKKQVDLLLQIIPYVAVEEDLALKGGTAINMFVWDMPRLSVDIDLTYLPFDDRKTALITITKCIARLKEKITNGIPGINITAPKTNEGQQEKLLCTLQNTQVKIEINTVMRGIIKPPQVMIITDAIQKEFNKFAEIKVISKGELFGGKLCAALDRQHPRDLFDVHCLLEKEGITEEIKQGFIAALLSHKRPINELLNPNLIEQYEAFAKQFIGMALRPFTYVDFMRTFESLKKQINLVLNNNDRQLLISFKSGEPDWSLSDIEQLKNLPAVQWKLANIKNLKKKNPEKHASLLNKLQEVLK